MTTLVIPFLPTEDDGLDLRYALRSVDRYLHLPEITVTVVGESLPSWVKPSVNFIEYGSPHEDKTLNIAGKVLAGCDSLAEEEIVYFEDDLLLLDHAETIPVEHYGTLDDHIADMIHSHVPDHWWPRTLMATRVFLRDFDNPLSWELHRPVAMQREPLMKVLDTLLDAQAQAWLKTVYGNLVGHPTSYEGWDGKGGRDASFPVGLPWLSTRDSFLADSRGQSFRNRLPRPSRWEAT